MTASCQLPARYLELIRRGEYPGRSPDIAVVPAEPNFFGTFPVTSHSGPWRYLQKVPLVFYGPGYIQSRGAIDLGREVTVADIAPTLADLLGVEWPADRPGRSITEALVPAADRPEPPAMILVVVWDGGGWNVLSRWPGRWPNLRKLMAEGTSLRGAAVGSSPSVTPAVHASIGTGAWPEQHGIVDLQFRDGDQVVGTFEGERPDELELTTLADLYDPTTDNQALVGMLAERNWHMGMVGHGAYIDGGDKDYAVFGEAGAEFYTNPKWYTLPEYVHDVGGLDEDIREVDLEDGSIDSTWVGNQILDEPDKLRQTPVSTIFQTRVLKTLFKREGFGTDATTDLFYTNYKQPDLAGHIYNMVAPEMRSSIEYADGELQKLTAWLNANVGAGRWVLTFTADHGQGPDPLTVGAWPIDIEELMRDAAARFDVTQPELFQKQRITGFWLNSAAMADNGITVEELANFFVDYRLRDNVAPGATVPEQYQDRLKEKLFAGAWPSTRLAEVVACTS
jgi:predicted AlkP superfamily pyrophosphatase or phosphodiesterase